ncbi:MAG: phosphoadenylyl-sulfate reductase [Bacteroidia bacterium]
MEQAQIEEAIKLHAIRTENLSPTDLLKYIDKAFGNSAVLTSSLGPEDQFITFLIAQFGLKIPIVTLDTGRLFPESYELQASTETRFNIKIEAFYPNQEEVETYVNTHGINAFYNSVELRKQCCFIRKVQPLKRALKNKRVWITGIRANQNDSRENLSRWEYDESNELLKVHPLLHLTDDELDAEIKSKNIPVNPLHKKGYASIGCAPCTRAIEENEHPRAGRWWWESDNKECGLHTKA